MHNIQFTVMKKVIKRNTDNISETHWFDTSVKRFPPIETIIMLLLINHRRNSQTSLLFWKGSVTTTERKQDTGIGQFL